MELVKFLCGHEEVKLDQKDENGLIPFQYAVINDDVNMVQWILDDQDRRKVFMETDVSPLMQGIIIHFFFPLLSKVAPSNFYMRVNPGQGIPII